MWQVSNYFICRLLLGFGRRIRIFWWLGSTGLWYRGCSRVGRSCCRIKGKILCAIVCRFCCAEVLLLLLSDLCLEGYYQLIAHRRVVIIFLCFASPMPLLSGTRISCNPRLRLHIHTQHGFRSDCWIMAKFDRIHFFRYWSSRYNLSYNFYLRSLVKNLRIRSQTRSMPTKHQNWDTVRMFPNYFAKIRYRKIKAYSVLIDWLREWNCVFKMISISCWVGLVQLLFMAGSIYILGVNWSLCIVDRCSNNTKYFVDILWIL